MKEDVLTIEVKYFDQNICKMEDVAVGEWMDLRVSRAEKGDDSGMLECYPESALLHRNKDLFLYCRDDYIVVYLGIGMVLPEGYEAHIIPADYMFADFGLIQTSGVCVVDGKKWNESDEWRVPCYALRPGRLEHNDPGFKFRIVAKMPAVKFIESN